VSIVCLSQDCGQKARKWLNEMVKDDRELPWTKRERASEKGERRQRERNAGQEIYNFQISFSNNFFFKS